MSIEYNASSSRLAFPSALLDLLIKELSIGGGGGGGICNPDKNVLVGAFTEVVLVSFVFDSIEFRKFELPALFCFVSAKYSNIF